MCCRLLVLVSGVDYRLPVLETCSKGLSGQEQGQEQELGWQVCEVKGWSPAQSLKGLGWEGRRERKWR